MCYKNEAGQSELALRHLGWSLLSKHRFHIKARQMFKVCVTAVLVNFLCGVSVILILNCVIAVFSESAG